MLPLGGLSSSLPVFPEGVFPSPSPFLDTVSKIPPTIRDSPDSCQGYLMRSLLTLRGTPLSVNEIHIYVPGNSEKELWVNCGSAVLRCCSQTDMDTLHEHENHPLTRSAVRGLRSQSSQTREAMSKFKLGNPWKSVKTNRERRGIRATDQRALKRRDKGVPVWGRTAVAHEYGIW